MMCMPDDLEMSGTKTVPDLPGLWEVAIHGASGTVIDA